MRGIAVPGKEISAHHERQYENNVRRHLPPRMPELDPSGCARASDHRAISSESGVLLNTCLSPSLAVEQRGSTTRQVQVLIPRRLGVSALCGQGGLGTTRLANAGATAVVRAGPAEESAGTAPIAWAHAGRYPASDQPPR